MHRGQSDPWKINSGKTDPNNYYGITVANGMIGIVSSPEPFKVKEVVLAGAYDLYGRGRVSNFLKSFNLLNMYLEIDGQSVWQYRCRSICTGTGYAKSSFYHPFDHADKAPFLILIIRFVIYPIPY